MIIAFDVDGTLVSYQDQPRRDIIQMLITFSELGNRIIVHSGGGKDYAEMWVRRLYLEPYVTECRAKPIQGQVAEDIDLAFDDELGQFGKLTIKV